MHADIGGLAHENVLVWNGDGFCLVVMFSDDDDSICHGSDIGAARLCDDIGQHESWSEFDDAGFLYLSVNGDSGFGDFFVDADNGRISEVFGLQFFFDNDFEFIASFSD